MDVLQRDEKMSKQIKIMFDKTCKNNYTILGDFTLRAEFSQTMPTYWDPITISENHGQIRSSIPTFHVKLFMQL
jgi:hypothetical protein